MDAADRKVLRDARHRLRVYYLQVRLYKIKRRRRTFYANNQGEPLRVVRQGLMALAEKYRKLGIQLEVLGLGTTGYGEQMLSAAFHAD